MKDKSIVEPLSTGIMKVLTDYTPEQKREKEIEGIKIFSLPLISTGEYLRVNDDLSGEWSEVY